MTDLAAFMGDSVEYGGRGYKLARAVVLGGWRYATDARILVRVPARGQPDTEDEGERLEFPDIAAFLAEEKADWSRCTERWPAPGDTRGTLIPCSICKCEPCSGSGKAMCAACGGDTGCEKCGGVGAEGRPDCPLCRGGGTVDVPKDMVIGGRKIAGEQLLKIATLENVRFRPDGDPETALFFVADGGVEGAVIPMRVREEVTDG